MGSCPISSKVLYNYKALLLRKYTTRERCKQLAKMFGFFKGRQILHKIISDDDTDSCHLFSGKTQDIGEATLHLWVSGLVLP